MTSAPAVTASAHYRALIVDDERFARVGLRAMLARYTQLGVVGVERDGEEAVKAIQDLRPDVVFLDIQMPGRDGFGVMRELAAMSRHPAYVFVTAHADHALEAYEVDAVDYLHKPFSDARLGRTIQRGTRRGFGSPNAAAVAMNCSPKLIGWSSAMLYASPVRPCSIAASTAPAASSRWTQGRTRPPESGAGIIRRRSIGSSASVPPGP